MPNVQKSRPSHNADTTTRNPSNTVDDLRDATRSLMRIHAGNEADSLARRRQLVAAARALNIPWAAIAADLGATPDALRMDHLRYRRTITTQQPQDPA